MLVTVNQATFNQEVLGSSVPVLVNFWAPWCGVCRMIGPMLSELKCKWGEHIKLVNINADENLKLANAYKLTSLPTVLLFDQGSLQYRLDYFKNRDDFQIAVSDLHTALTALVLQDSFSASA